MAYDGVNFLIPADMRKVKEQSQLKLLAIPMHDVLEQMITSTGDGIKLSILDCCRDRVFEQVATKGVRMGTKSADFSNLAKMAISTNTFEMFATSDSTVANAGKSNGLSPFTSELVKRIPEPGLEVKDLGMEVRKSLMHTGAIPQEQCSMVDHFFFVEN